MEEGREVGRTIGRFVAILWGLLALTAASAGAVAQGVPSAAAVPQLDTVVVGTAEIPPRVYKYAYRNGMATSLAQVEEALASELATAFAATGQFRVRQGQIAAGEGEATVYTVTPRFEAFEDLVVGTELPQLKRIVVVRKASLTVALQATREADRQALPLLPTATAVQVEEDIYPSGQEPQPSPRLLQEVARETATKLARTLLAQLNPPKILAASEWQVVLNRGSNGGFQVGDRVQFYAVREGDDPATADRATEGTVVGEGVLVRVYGDQSRATIVGENLGIAVGCLARPLLPAEATPESSAAAP
jgi:hypothetical protein